MAIRPEPALPELPAPTRRAMELALRSLSPREVERTNLAVVTAPQTKGARLLAYSQALQVEPDSIVVFADEMSLVDSDDSKASSRGLFTIPMRMSTTVSVPGAGASIRAVH